MAKNYPALYEALGVEFVNSTGEWWTARCSLHDDQSASFSVEAKTGQFKCFVPSCKGFKGGRYFRYHELKTGKSPAVPIEVVEKYHQALLKNPASMRWLVDMRGLDNETIEHWKLGWDDDRLTIPVFEDGICYNVRRHSPKKATNKTLHYEVDYGRLRLFHQEALAADTVMLCEGELDTILANRIGFNALCVTSGAGSWRDEFTPKFAGKTVYVVYDIDDAGRRGAEIICEKLHGVAKVVKNILLPITTPANGDLTDYVVKHGFGHPDLEALCAGAPAWKKDEKPAPVEPSEAQDVDFGDAAQSRYVGQQVRFRATVAGKDLAPYACPAETTFTCKMGLKICAFCSIGQNNGTLKYQVPGHGLEVLRLINCTEDQQKGFLKKAAGVYPTCPRFNLSVQKYHTVEDIRMIPEISFSSMATAEYVVRQGYHVGHGLVANQVYEFEGSVVPNPKNQYITFVLPKSKPVKDSVTGFKLTEEQIEALKVFQGEDVEQKMFDIAKDLTANVTKIYQREDLVVFLDLIYHSVLQFEFQGRIVRKGWIEGLVLGDTRCGKTETMTCLIEHYKAGELCTGENASFAGLLGGMQQVGSRWSIIWGKWPLNDRRLLHIDEVSGMPVEDIGKLSGVRSSGIAEITKVQQEKTFARTRTVWGGNARSSRSLATYDSGVLAIRELIGRPEDIARFDIAITVASGEVAIEIINRQKHEKVPHTYTSELCHNLVLWAWSRQPKDVHFTPEAVQECLDSASGLSRDYSSAIPLVEPAEQRIKVARLAVACAARLFSTETGEEVVVRKEHVQFVTKFLRKLFEKPSMNYGAYSKAQMADLTLKNEDIVRGALQPYGMPLVEGFLERQYIRQIDLEDLLNLEKAQVKPIISKLVQQRALKHMQNNYVKTPAFIEFLKKMLTQGHLGETVPSTDEY